MSKERELLERVLDAWDGISWEHHLTMEMEDIRAYLAEPEKQREPLSEEEIDAGYDYESVEHNVDSWWDFQRGIRFAEKHHGIGGEG